MEPILTSQEYISVDIRLLAFGILLIYVFAVIFIIGLIQKVNQLEELLYSNRNSFITSTGETDISFKSIYTFMNRHIGYLAILGVICLFGIILGLILITIS
jgi:hypothetical protein